MSKADREDGYEEKHLPLKQRPPAPPKPKDEDE
ncbi:hypothetical protein EZJ58_5154 [Sodalis ligni]|uniref:Uncharacterized protein n=1 Tax=Sodalis ligni TaxID=2697027 RepID=A0A4R1NIE0_9GAMM|nr:hypothetical protein EZJ58_5154 [Sodalis ligni]